MKMKLLIGSAFGLALFLAGCTGSDGSKENQLVPLSKNIEYNVSISSQYFFRHDPYSSASAWDRYNIEASSRITYLKMLLEKAESDALKLTTMDGKPIESADLSDYFYTDDTVTYTRDHAPFDNYDTVIRAKKFGPENIINLRFKEDWSYNPRTFAVTKKIIAVAPLVSNITWNDETKTEEIEYPGKPAFWINFDEKSTPTHTLTNRIITNVPFRNEQLGYVKNQDSVALSKYFELLIQALSKDSLSCYVNSDTDIFDSLVSVKDFNNMVEKTSVSFKNIGNIRFMEEWTFDITTMALAKKVVGVCAIEESYDEVTGEFRGYRPLFFVYFDDVWAPFTKKLALKK